MGESIGKPRKKERKRKKIAPNKNVIKKII